jgi:hypothetical protein
MSAITLEDTERFHGRPTLRLDGCDSLSCLGESPDLEVLVLQHFPKITSLEPLRSLTKLRYLSLTTTPGWDGTNRYLSVDTFEPLVSLKKLELLQILGVVPKRGCLEPLGHIASLRKLSIGNTSFYQLEDFAALSVALPLARKSLQPVCQMNFISMCRRCRMHPLLFLEGAMPRSPRYVCPSCGKKKIVAHLDRWNRADGKPEFTGAEEMSPVELVELFGNPNAR